MEKNILKECPFCGGKAGVIKTNTLHGVRFWVKCMNNVSCNALDLRTKAFNERRQAIEAWNKRAEK